jgi:hypothetical protein
MDKLQSGNFCPLIKKDCVKFKCSWYMHIRGMNPNTGEDVDHWGCAVSWMPMLAIENSQQQRSTGAAVESFRNEMVKANENSINALTAAAQMLQESKENAIYKVIPANVTEVNNNESNNNI